MSDEAIVERGFVFNKSKFVRVFVDNGLWKQYAICVTPTDRLYGWLFGSHNGVQWTSIRRANDDELLKAEAVLIDESEPVPTAHVFDRKEYGARIAVARARKEWSQADLAFRLGWQPSMVSHHERGIRGPSAENLVLLCSVLGVSADWLLGRTTE